MNDNNLATFRSEMPVPDDDTTQRIYQQATSGRRRLMTRPRLVAAVAVLAAAGIAGGLTLTLGGGGKTSGSIQPGLHPGGPGGGMALAPFSLTPHTSSGELSSIDVTLRSTRSDNTLEVKVVDASNHVVYSEQVTPTVSDSSMQDATHASWTGSLTPGDWTGGCQAGLYRVEYTFGPDTDSGATDWFRCTGIVGPTGASGPTG